jgi:hypothetical protein
VSDVPQASVAYPLYKIPTFGIPKAVSFQLISKI